MFFLKDKTKDSTTIEAIVRYKGQRYKFATGEKVLSKFWNYDKERCKEVKQYEDASNINLRLETWEKHVKKVINDFSLKFKVPSPEEFKEALKKEAYGAEEDPVNYFSDFAKEFKKKSSKALGTTKSYQTTINWIEEYEKKIKRKLLFTDIDSSFYDKFTKFIMESGKVHSPNFLGTIIKNIKVFASEANVNLPKSFKTIALDVDNIYLTTEELIKIHKLEITEDLIKEDFPKLRAQNVRNKLRSMEQCRGWFLIGSFTALRVSDFSRIEDLNIKGNFIRIRTDKTDYPVVIPIHWVIKEILERGFDLSDRISDQKLNKQIKNVCKYAGIKEQVALSQWDSGKRIDVVKEKHEWVTTHTARRSGATNMYKAGIPTLSIMKITGHKTEKSFLKYIKVTQEENAQMLAEHAFFKK